MIVGALMMLNGCDGFVKSTVIDLGFLNPTPVPTVCPVVEECPTCEEALTGHLGSDWLAKVDGSIKMNHYIDDVLVDENYATLGVSCAGENQSSNPITLPMYDGSPIKHILIVEFVQVR